MNKFFVLKRSIENDNMVCSIVSAGVKEKEHGAASVFLEGVFGGILGSLSA